MKKIFKKLSLMVLFVVFVLTPLTGEGSYRYKMESRKTYSVKPGTKMMVSNQNGKIEIETWDKNEVEVFAVIGSDKSMKEVTKVKIEVSVDKNIEIATRYSGKEAEESKGKENEFGVWSFIKWVLKGEYSGHKIAVDYEIKIPDYIFVSEVETSNGKIGLNGTKGPSELNTTNGKIKVENVESDIKAHSTNGTIEIENVNGFVTAGTTNGKIRVKSEGVKELTTTNGSIEADIKTIEEDIEISTTNGSINLAVPSSLNANLELSTTNGEVNLEDVTLEDISRHQKNYIKGKMGKGGSKVNASTTNGSIKVRKLQK
jgi:hypothetical protein